MKLKISAKYLKRQNTPVYLCVHSFVSHVKHYIDVIMTTMASQITRLTVVYSIVYSGADQGKHQSSASQAFVRGIHRWPGNSPHKWPATRKMFPFDGVIMLMNMALSIPFGQGYINVHMVTSSNKSIFRVTGHLCGEFTGPRWIPRTKVSDAEFDVGWVNNGEAGDLRCYRAYYDVTVMKSIIYVRRINKMLHIDKVLAERR